MLVDSARFVLTGEITLNKLMLSSGSSTLGTVFEWKIVKKSSTRCSKKT